MDKFTPGPWEWSGDYLDGQGGAEVISVSVNRATYCSGCPATIDISNRDRMLIAAAPELYLALERALNRLDLLYRYQPVHDFCETIAEAQAALAKADGT